MLCQKPVSYACLENMLMFPINTHHKNVSVPLTIETLSVHISIIIVCFIIDLLEPSMLSDWTAKPIGNNYTQVSLLVVSTEFMVVQPWLYGTCT